MLPFINIAAATGTLFSIAWLVISLLKSLLPTSRANAIKGLKRSTAMFFACAAIAVASAAKVTDPPNDKKAAVPDLATDDNINGLTVALPASPPQPTARPVDEPAAAVARTSEKKKLSSSQEFIWILTNQELLARKLRDPDSAKFGKDVVSYKSGAPVVCGTVNAKNGFGGYMGAERWVGMGTTIGAFLSSEVADFDNLWRKVC